MNKSVDVDHFHSSFRPPFVWGAQGPLPNWDFGGNTVITESYVRLTPDRQSRRGFVWNKNPVHLKAWEIEMEFHVHGQGRHTFGDGFAFWYTRESQQQGPAYGNTMKFNGLGVIFDTFDNDKNVRLSIQVILWCFFGLPFFDQPFAFSLSFVS